MHPTNGPYDKAAARIGSDLVQTFPSRAQLHRWLSGSLRGLPYADHCRVLEEMLPGWTAEQHRLRQPTRQARPPHRDRRASNRHQPRRPRSGAPSQTIAELSHTEDHGGLTRRQRRALPLGGPPVARRADAEPTLISAAHSAHRRVQRVSSSSTQHCPAPGRRSRSLPAVASHAIGFRRTQTRRPLAKGFGACEEDGAGTGSGRPGNRHRPTSPPGCSYRRWGPQWAADA